MTRADSLRLELQAEQHNHQRDNESFVAEIERLRVQRDEQDGSIKRLLDDLDAAQTTIERLQAIEAAAKEVIDVMDRATSSAKARRLSIINLRAALEPKP